MQARPYIGKSASSSSSASALSGLLLLHRSAPALLESGPPGIAARGFAAKARPALAGRRGGAPLIGCAQVVARGVVGV